MRDKTIKPLEENLGVNLQNLQWGSGFLDTTPKPQITKDNRYIELHQVKRFCASTDTIKKVKRQYTEWKKIFLSHTSGKEPVSEEANTHIPMKSQLSH